MKKWSLYCGLILAIVSFSCNRSNFGDKKADSSLIKSATVKEVDSVTMNKAWTDYMKPGTAHKMLSRLAGKWDAEISFYYDPDSPSVNRSTTESKMIMGGRYLQSAYIGAIDGMPFEGLSTMAFDNAKKVFISTWFDNMGTGMMYLEGTYNEKLKLMTLKGNATDVVTGEDIKLVQKIKFIDDDSQLTEMYETKDGDEMKTMSILLTKR